MDNIIPYPYWLIPVGLYAGVWIALVVAVVIMATRKDEASKTAVALFAAVGFMALAVASLIILAIVF